MDQKRNLAIMVWNFIGYQLVWAAVIYGAHMHEWPFGISAGIIFVAIHFLLSTQRLKDLLVMVSVMMIGLILDKIGIFFHLYYFIDKDEIRYFPLWLPILWGSFALTLEYSLAWLQNRLVLAGLLGAIFGPLAYLGPAKMRLAIMPHAAVTMAILAVMWFFLMPALMALIRNIPSQFSPSKAQL
ncbi:MAG: DUF2878 domain-containing protein [Candidatus Margulisiibacteriota bacterium]